MKKNNGISCSVAKNIAKRMFVNWKPVFRENKPLTPRKSADFVTGKGIKREGRENGLSVRELAREQKREGEGKG